MPISINFLANTKAVIRGTDDIEKALGDVASSLDDLARDAGTQGDKIGDGISDGVRDAAQETERATEKMERSFKDLADASKNTGRDIERNVKKGTDGAREGLRDMKQEAGSTARESAASFDGSATSIAGSFQEIAANSFVGFGPAGAAAGIAAAAGLGLASAGFAANEAAAAAMEEKTVSAFDRMIEAGGRFITAEQENAAIQEALNDPAALKLILDIVKDTGLAQGDVTRAVALGGSEVQGVIRGLEKARDAQGDVAVKSTQGKAIVMETTARIRGQIRELEQRGKVESEAVKRLELYDAATGSAMAKHERDGELIRARNRSLANTPKTVKTRLDVDDSDLERKLARSRTIRLGVEGYIAANGRKIF